VQIVDTKSDLNAYSKVEGALGCCSAPAPSGPALPVSEEEWVASSQACCGTATARGCCSTVPDDFHEELADLLSLVNVNDYVASVRVLR